jgi:Mrp family chromosome partitioning ATPase
MGEIADALRRTRGVLFPTPSELPASELPAPSSEMPRRATREQPPGQRLDTIEPTRPAIVLRDEPAVEACRHLAVKLRAELDRRGAGAVAIVSAVRGEGKTTVACDLALALASVSRAAEVALVDLDLRNPSVARYLGFLVDVGVEDFFAGQVALDDTRVEVANPRLDIFPALRPTRDAHQLLVLPALGRLIAELRQRYAVVVVDTPPALVVPDASLILREVPACVAVARAGVTRARFFRELVEALPHQRLIGEVLNDARSAARPYYGSYTATRHEDEVRDEAAAEPRRRWGRLSARSAS